MENIKSFNDIIKILTAGPLRRRVAVVWASNEATREAVGRALALGFVEALFVGCEREVRSDESLAPYASHISFIEAADPDEAARKGVEMVRLGQADVLMKGMINTDNLLRAVLNKEHGIRVDGQVITHITASQIPSYPRLLFFSDAAVIPVPTLEQRIAQVRYIVGMLHNLGVTEPKVGLIHCSEKVDERHFPVTADYVVLKKLAAEGEFGDCIVDGPLDLKCACSLHALEEKGLHSPLEGEADAVIFPDIEAGNVFYKTITLFSDAITAGVLWGTKAPVVLPSRGDSQESKLYSLALASLL